MTNSRYTNLRCSLTGKIYDKNEVHTFCLESNQPLVAEYDMSSPLDKRILKDRPLNMWRYREMLPIENMENIVSLGEGMTPLLPVPELGAQLGIHNLWVKDEGNNPTGSFKARGLGMAVSKAKELGVTQFAIPTAGNAGSALSAYCAKAGLDAFIFMPKQTPLVFQLDCKVTGAKVTMVDGNIRDCGAMMAEQNKDKKWFEVTTLKEPFRLEGKKTMGYEIAEQLNWELPDVIIYPTGGGTGLIGIWKAFQEMKSLGWIDHIPTRMVAVQVAGCNPIVQAFEAGQEGSEPYPDPEVTIANGLRVPHAFGHRLILKTLYDSNGKALAVTDAEMLEGIKEMASKAGLFVSPEGAAVWMGLRKLVEDGWVKSDEKVVLLNTGSAYKYAENIHL